MSRFDLDFLVRELQYAAGNAQRAVRGEQEGVLKRIIDLGGEGEPQYLTWVLSIPFADGREGTYEMVRIPMISLQDTRMMEISEFSVAFDCKIEKSPQQEVRDSSKLVVIPRRRARKHKKGVHIVKITLRDPDSGEGDVTVDGVVLKKMSDMGSQSVGGEGSCESSCLLSEDELNQLLQEDRGRAKRLFRWKTLLVCFFIGLLVAAIAILVIRMGS